MATIDLHAHTTASDGMDTPAQLVQAAVAGKLDMLALTDHDSVSGVREAKAAAAACGLALVGGVEFSAAFAGELHILGYGVDIQDDQLRHTLQGVLVAREQRNRAMMAKLRELGMPIDEQAVGAATQEHSAGRVHMAREMVQKGYVATVDDAFQKYLRLGCPAYVPRMLPQGGEILDIIRRAGGVAVLAHPLKTRLSQQALWALLEEYAAQGLWGVEVYHPSCTPQQSAIYRRMAQALRLYCTAGSDYHGDRGSGRHGNALIPWDTEMHPELQSTYLALQQFL